MLETPDELGSAVAGGLLFLLQPPLPPVILSTEDLRQMGALYRFPFTPQPISDDRIGGFAAIYRPLARELFVRAWVEDGFGIVQILTLLETSEAILFDGAGREISVGVAATDPAGAEYMTFTFPVVLALSHAYKIRMSLRSGTGRSFYRDFHLSVSR